MINLFYLSLFIFSFLISKVMFSEKTTKYNLVHDYIKEVTQRRNFKKEVILINQKLHNTNPESNIISFAKLPKDLEKISKKSDIHSQLAALIRTPILDSEEVIVIDESQFEISASDDDIKQAFNDFAKSESIKKDPILKGNFLMMMSNIHSLKEDVRQLSMQVAKETRFKHVDKNKINTEKQINDYLSDNIEFENVLMSYDAYLNTFNGEDVNLLSETMNLIEYHNNEFVRRAIASSFVDTYPDKYEALQLALKAQQIEIQDLEKVEIPIQKQQDI